MSRPDHGVSAPPTDIFSRHGRAMLVAFACLVPLVAWAAAHAYDRRDNSVLGWLPERSPVTLAYREFLRIFGPDETALVSWEGCVLDDTGLERLATAIDEQRAAVAAGTAADWFAAVTTGTRLRGQVAEAADVSDEEAARRLQGTLVGPDGTSTCAVVTLRPLDDQRRREAVEWLAATAARAAGIDRTAVRLTGDAVISVGIDTENERTAGTWSTVAMLVALAAAWATLGSLGRAAMVLAVSGFASLAIEAVIWCSGGSMNMLVSLVPVVTFVLAISAAVHLIGYWTEALATHGAAGAPLAAVAAGWQPSLVAAVTTVLGMVSLAASQVRPVWQFGVYAAIGTAIAFASVFLGLPALLRTFAANAVVARRRGDWPAVTRSIRRLVSAHRVTTPLCLLAMLAGAAGLTRLETEVRPARFLPLASVWRRDLDWFTQRIGPFQTVDVVLTFAASPPDLGDRAAVVQEIAARLGRLDAVHGSLSAATLLPAELLGSADRGAVRSVVRRSVIDGRLRRALPTLVAAGLVAPDGPRQLWRISLQVANFTAEQQPRLEQAVATIVREAAADLGVAPPDANSCTGGVPLVIAAQRELLDSLLESFALAFITIAGVLAVFFRSLPLGLLSMIPNLFPIVLVGGGLGWLGRPLDVGGMMTASIALGIAVDDSVHLLTWVRRLARTGLTPDACIDGGLDHAAMPMIGSTLILAPAFAVFGFCGFQPIAQFGLLLATLVAVALVGDLVQLPALIAGPLGRWCMPHRVISPPLPAGDTHGRVVTPFRE